MDNYKSTQSRNTAWRRLALAVALMLMLSVSCSAFQQTTPVSRKSFVKKTEPKTQMSSDDKDFWAQQKELANQMLEKDAKIERDGQKILYEERARGLVGDTTFFSLLIFPVLWLCFDNPMFSISYLLGAAFGLAYSYGLTKYVATVGGSVDDVDAVEGAGVGQARFAFLILLFVFVGKFKSAGLIEIPTILGFFTYQLASLSQGLKEYND